MNILTLCLVMIGFLLLGYSAWGLLAKCLASRAEKPNPAAERNFRHELATVIQLVLIIIVSGAGAVFGLRMIDGWIAGR